MKPVLQVALDLVNMDRAFQIAREAVEGGVDWLEAGTPLIKAEGMNAVRRLAELEAPVVADMKTMDVGDIEVEMAAKAGASVVCLLGVASDETLREGIAAAHRYGTEILVDLIGVPHLEERARQVEELGADYVGVHVSIDEQMTGRQPFEDIQRVASCCSIPVAAAGGITSETAPLAIENGACIVIVGGAIIKAEQVSEAARTIKMAMREGKAIKSDQFKKYGRDEIRQALQRVSACNVCDAMHNAGGLRGIRPLKEGYHLVGPALTVKTLDGDWAKVVEAIDIANEGDIIVVQAAPGNQAVWGELATWSAVKNGIGGVVIDGAVRDVGDIRQQDIPVFSRHMVAEAGEPKGYGEIGYDIICGGQPVRSGDWLVGDDSGLVVIPKERAQEIANRAVNVHERENRMREEIKRGSSLGRVLELEKWEKKR
ncbi:MAG: 3-hexulose-6-phosphate synthase [Thermoplasmatota archaeon]